jgi:hypothetical protein
MIRPKVDLVVTKRADFPADKFVLSVFSGSREDADRYKDDTQIDPANPEAMEILKMGIYLLNYLDKVDDQYSSSRDRGLEQQSIIFEAGKKLFLSHNPIRPICSLFPMGPELITKEYPAYANGYRGILLIDEGWGEHEWPSLDEDPVIIQGWSVCYFDKEGKEYLVETNVKVVDEREGAKDG